MLTKSLKYILLFISLAACDAYADSDALDLCLEKQAYLFKDLGLPVEPPKYDNLGQCVESFVESNRAGYHLRRLEAESPCGFICKKKQDFLRSFYGFKGYANLIKKSLDEKDQQAIESHLGISIIDYIEAEISRAPKYGFPFLKKIIKDFSEVLIEIQLKRVDFEKQKITQSEATEIMMSEIKECLKDATTETGIKFCVAIFKNNTTYKLGALIQKELLNRYFSNNVPKGEFDNFLQDAKKSYNVCALEYFYASVASKVKVSEKILPCVYNSIFESFLKVAVKTVQEKSELTEVEASGAVFKLVGSCSENQIIQKKGVERYKILQTYDEESFTDYLLNCQSSLTVGVVGEVGVQTIAGHPSVVDILGKAKAQAFANAVIEESLPECVNRLGVSSSPEHCKNYLFARTVSKLFPIVLDERISAYKNKYTFLSTELITESKDNGLAELDKCQRESYKDFKTYSRLDSKVAEVTVAKCLRESILVSLDKIVDAYIANELSNNKTLVENGIDFDFKRKRDIKLNFISCSALNIRTGDGLDSVLESSQTFLDTCILSNTKDVVNKVFRDLVVENLLSAGLTGSQSRALYAKYKTRENGLLYKVNNAQTSDEMNGVLENAKPKVVLDLSDDVIRILVLKKSPVKFSEKNMLNLISTGKKTLKKCLPSSTVRACADKAEDAVVRLAVKLFLPTAVNDEFVDKLSPSLSRKEINQFKIKSRIANSLKEVEASDDKPKIVTTGSKILDFITSEIKKETSIDKIKSNPRVIKYVLDVAFFPVSKQLLGQLISKESPIKFNKSDLNRLVSLAESSLVSCLDKGLIEVCADEATTKVMKAAVKIFFPAAVNDEFKGALSKWVSKAKVNSLGIQGSMKSALNNSKEGTAVVDVIVTAIEKGQSVGSIKKNKVVTGFISSVLTKAKLPKAYGLAGAVLDEVSVLVIQKEINNFVKSAKSGDEGFFLNLGVKIRFAGRNKEALNWRKSKSTEDGKLATVTFKNILTDVIKTSREITDADKTRVEKHVTDAVLSYRRKFDFTSKKTTKKSKKTTPKAKSKKKKVRKKARARTER